jgi:hypothetical protein
MRYTKWLISLAGCLWLAWFAAGCNAVEREQIPDTILDRSILVFSKTDGFRHDSIEPGVEAVQALGEANGVFVFATEDAGYFNPDAVEQSVDDDSGSADADDAEDPDEESG